MLDPRRKTLPNGKALRYVREGHGPPLILTHGYPENLQIYSRLVPLLKENFDVIAFDWPGLGGSEAWSGGKAPEHKVDRLMTLMDVWDLESACLCGNDMGGQPVLVAAAEHPDRIDGIAVMNSLLYGEEETSWEIDLLRKFKFNRFVLRHLPHLVFYRALWTFLPLNTPLDRYVKNDLWKHFRQSDVREFIIRMCAAYEGALPRMPDYYNRVDEPVLVLWGENEKHFPPHHARRLTDQISQAELEIVEEGDHWMMWQKPDAVASALVSFFKSPYAK